MGQFWAIVNNEEVYLCVYETVSAARSGIWRYLEFYNSRRPHRALDGTAPDAFYYESLPALAQAA